MIAPELMLSEVTRVGPLVRSRSVAISPGASRRMPPASCCSPVSSSRVRDATRGPPIRAVAGEPDGLKQRRISPSPSAAPFRHENTVSPSSASGGSNGAAGGKHQEPVAVVLATRAAAPASSRRSACASSAYAARGAQGIAHRASGRRGPAASGRVASTSGRAGDQADARSRVRHSSSLRRRPGGPHTRAGPWSSARADRARRCRACAWSGPVARSTESWLGRRSGRWTSANCPSARTRSIGTAPAGNTARSRWSRASLSSVVRNSTRLMPCTRRTTVVIVSGAVSAPGAARRRARPGARRDPELELMDERTVAEDARWPLRRCARSRCPSTGQKL